ncbi:MAG: FtsX-like permease family protein [Pseudomonadota bacterium]
MRAAARIAWRELRGGSKGFRIFLICLALGVAAIAAVGMVRESVRQGLMREGATLLGGDAEMEFTYRFAAKDELAWMETVAPAYSAVVDFRSMAVVEQNGQVERGLTQVKSVDAAYPLIGAVELAPSMSLAEALQGNGAAMDRILADRLGLTAGDSFRLGTNDFTLRAIIEREPDGAGDGFRLGPRTLVRTNALDGSGLLEPGTLFSTKYRLLLPENTDLAALKAEAEARFDDSGLRWRDRRNGAPGIQEFVERVGAFLALVGLAGLIVGGIGVSAAVRAYLSGKTATIATLRTLGADRRTIFLIYLGQIAALTLTGVALGLLLGGALPLVLAAFIETRLPVPVAVALYPRPLAEAALSGVLTALIFTLWPLAQTENVRAAALFRTAFGRMRPWPRPPYLLTLGLLLVLLVGAAALVSGAPWLALYMAIGVLCTLVLLALMTFAIRTLARRLARAVRGRPILRLALGAIGGPREETGSVILSLGLGLTALTAVSQIEANLREAIIRDLPGRAPSYFFVDIQNDQLQGFRARLDEDPAVSRLDTAPMLRGVITRINGRPARETAGDHWVLSGDRGVTYAAEPSPQTTVTAGEWWPADYTGEPQISFAAEEAEEMGLKLGDDLTVNILGRDITGTLTSFRAVDFSTAGIGFIMSMNPAALAGAPHTHIATVYAEATAEAAILRDLASAYPNITAVRVRDAIDRVSDVLSGLAAAVGYGAVATLIMGGVVLIGTAGAVERARVYEAAILKTIGGPRGRILSTFALRSALLGMVAGGVALFCGTLASWSVMTFVIEADFTFHTSPALAIVAAGIVATLLAGAVFAWRPLAVRPARVLRNRD